MWRERERCFDSNESWDGSENDCVVVCELSTRDQSEAGYASRNGEGEVDIYSLE